MFDRLDEAPMGLVLVTATAFAFSTAGYFTRLILLDVWTVLLWRGVFGGLAIGAYVVWQHRRQTVAVLRAADCGGIAVALLLGARHDLLNQCAASDNGRRCAGDQCHGTIRDGGASVALGL